MRSGTMALMLTAGALAVMLIGCGGGGGQAPAVVGAASVHGTVSAPSVASAQVTTAASSSADCQVTVERTRDRELLRQGRTDAGGQYEFHGLRPGEDVTVRAQLPGGDVLRTRLKLQDGTCQADVDEDSTLVAEVLDALDGAAGTSAVSVSDTVSQICAQYQHQNRYQYRHQAGKGPDFSNPDEVALTSVELVAAATDDACQQALQTRSGEDCEGAVTMLMLRLCQTEQVRSQWDDATLSKLALALRTRTRVTTRQMAQAATQALGVQVSEADIVAARQRLRERIQVFAGQDMEVCEGLACLALGGDMERIRLRTRSQVQTCLNGLPPTEG